MMIRILLLVAAVALLAGCHSERYESEDLGTAVQVICPGDPSGMCDWTDAVDATLRVGFAAVDISPAGYETWTDVDGNGEFQNGLDEFDDCGLDRLCPGDDGYSAPDEGEGDGQFQGMWLAGFGNSRAMNGIGDPIWARVTWLEQGQTSLGIVSIDVVGWFYDEVLELRAAVKEELDLDHVIVSSTHVHEAPDTMGQWGQDAYRSGVNPTFQAGIHAGIRQGLAAAKESAVPADVYAGSYAIGHDEWEGTGVNNVNLDTRDPNITDETVRTVRFTATGTQDTLGVWINFPNHPEASGSDNLMLSSDFAHTLRTTVEEGAEQGPEGALAGAGGVAIYIQGACGGMMTPLRNDVIDLDGTLHTEHGLEKAYAAGRVTGYVALQAIGSEALVEEPLLSFRARDLFIPVENTIFHLALNAGVFDRQGYNYDPEVLISEYNRPDLLTEVSSFELGSISGITLPGELLPELAIGGYDGSHTGPVEPIVQEDNPNPPDLAAAPAGPYLLDRLEGDHTLLFGLANDEIGYIVPDYNYKLDEGSPYWDEPDGDHYEETNSVGPQARGLLEDALVNLLEWTPPE